MVNLIMMPSESLGIIIKLTFSHSKGKMKHLLHILIYGIKWIDSNLKQKCRQFGCIRYA